MAFRLSRLQRTVEIVEKAGTPTRAFQQWWQSIVSKLETQETNQDQLITDLQDTQAELAVAQADLAAAVADIAAAQADITAAEADIVAINTDIGTIYGTLPNYVVKDVGAAWTAPTGTASRATFATYGGQTVSNPPTQAEVQAIDDHVVILSQRLKALIDDLQANGALT